MLSQTNLLLLGKNCGPAKLSTQLDTGNTILDEETFSKIVSKEWDFRTYILKFKTGICPKCSSKNTKLNPVNGITFWGCDDCLFGWWEKYLPDDTIKQFCHNKDLKYQVHIYLPYRKAEKKKPKKSDGSVQLTLF